MQLKKMKRLNHQEMYPGLTDRLVQFWRIAGIGMSMSDNILDEGVALLFKRTIPVEESESMTACELARQTYDRLLCVQQTRRQLASKRKRKSSSYQKKTC
jgi:hypothetical protein